MTFHKLSVLNTLIVIKLTTKQFAGFPAVIWMILKKDKRKRPRNFAKALSRQEKRCDKMTIFASAGSIQ